MESDNIFITVTLAVNRGVLHKSSLMLSALLSPEMISVSTISNVAHKDKAGVVLGRNWELQAICFLL